MKDEFGGKLMTELIALISQTHSYLTDDNNGNKKTKGFNKGCKTKLKLEDYKHSLEATNVSNKKKLTWEKTNVNGLK